MPSYDSPQLNTLLGGTASSEPKPKQATATKYDSAQLSALLGNQPEEAPVVKDVPLVPVKPVTPKTLFPESSKIKNLIKNLFGKKDTGPALQAKIGENLSPEDATRADLMIKNQPKAPGTTIKAPFMNKGIQVPEKGGVGAAYGLLKMGIEFPEKTVKTIFQQNDSDNRQKQFVVPSYNEVAAKTTAQLMDEGMPKVAAVILGSAKGAGDFANDALIYEGLLASGARKTESALSKITNDELKTAHEFLGNPKTLEEARIARNKIQREFHPDKTGGSDAVSKQANNAYRILEKEGIPVGGKAKGKVDNRPQAEMKRIGEEPIHPTLKKEVQVHLQEHGSEVTHQGLVEKLGVTHEQATKIIRIVRQEGAMADPAKIAEQVLARVVPPKEIKTSEIPKKEEISTSKYKKAEEIIKPEYTDDIEFYNNTHKNIIENKDDISARENAVSKIDEIIRTEGIEGAEMFKMVVDRFGKTQARRIFREGYMTDTMTPKQMNNLFDKKLDQMNNPPIEVKKEPVAVTQEKKEIESKPAPKKEEIVEETPKEKEKKQFNSRVFERLQSEHSELQGDLKMDEVKLKEDAERAVELLATDKQKAFRIAMGAEQSDEVLSSSVNIAMAEKALEEGNNALFSQLVKNRSLAQSRRGQEIVAEKGSITDNSTTRYVKELLAARLEKLGERYLANIKLEKSNGGLGVSVKSKVSNKKRAADIIKGEVQEVKKKISSTKEMDLASAQKLIDSLAC